jgi:hypothetical protein
MTEIEGFHQGTHHRWWGHRQLLSQTKKGIKDPKRHIAFGWGIDFANITSANR